MVLVLVPVPAVIKQSKASIKINSVERDEVQHFGKLVIVIVIGVGLLSINCQRRELLR